MERKTCGGNTAQSAKCGKVPKATRSQPQQKEACNDSSPNSNGNASSPRLAFAAARRRERKVPTEADMKRYEGYVGQRWTGKCRWFNVSKGFGFLIPYHEEARNAADDVFVHQVFFYLGIIIIIIIIRFFSTGHQKNFFSCRI